VLLEDSHVTVIINFLLFNPTHSGVCMLQRHIRQSAVDRVWGRLCLNRHVTPPAFRYSFPTTTRSTPKQEYVAWNSSEQIMMSVLAAIRAKNLQNRYMI